LVGHKGGFGRSNPHKKTGGSKKVRTDTNGTHREGGLRNQDSITPPNELKKKEHSICTKFKGLHPMYKREAEWWGGLKGDGKGPIKRRGKEKGGWKEERFEKTGGHNIPRGSEKGCGENLSKL